MKEGERMKGRRKGGMEEGKMEGDGRNEEEKGRRRKEVTWFWLASREVQSCQMLQNLGTWSSLCLLYLVATGRFKASQTWILSSFSQHGHLGEEADLALSETGEPWGKRSGEEGSGWARLGSCMDTDAQHEESPTTVFFSLPLPHIDTQGIAGFISPLVKWG